MTHTGAPISRTDALAAALRAVSAAAIVTRAVQRQQQRGKIDKADGSPVTIADFAAQAAIVRELNRSFPGATPPAIAGEESSAYLRHPAHEHERRAALAAVQLVWPDATDEEFLAMIDRGASTLEGTDRPDAFWTIDPIDGTKGFIRGHQYSICLALVEHGHPTVAALACPNLSVDLDRPFDQPDPHGTTMLATIDGTVLTLPTDEPGSTPRPLERAHRAVSGLAPTGGIRFCESWEGSHSDQSASRRVMQRLADQGHALGPPARIDSQCKYAVVARGQVDVFLRRPRDVARRDWIWDHAPGWLIASRAGLTVSDAHAQSVNFGLGRTLASNHGVLAASAPIHPLVAEALRAL